MNLSFGTFLFPAVLLLLTSCQKDALNETAEEGLLSTSANVSAEAKKPQVSGEAAANMLESELLKSVRQATSRFHSTTQAMKAGYEPDDHCVSVPGLGGMGYHWVNPGLVDPVFDPLQPEIALYASGPGGKLRLVALEYIVINVGQPAPMFGDQPFDVGGTPVPVDHWSLHVWLYENNPSGIFMPFNPNITCP